MVRFQGQKLRTGLGMRADEGVTGLQTPPSGAARVVGFRLRFRSPVEVLFEQQTFQCMDDVACCECAKSICNSMPASSCGVGKLLCPQWGQKREVLSSRAQSSSCRPCCHNTHAEIIGS